MRDGWCYHPAGASLIHREELAGPITDVRSGCHDGGAITACDTVAADAHQFTDRAAGGGPSTHRCGEPWAD